MGLFDRFRKKQTRERLAAISKGGEKAQTPDPSVPKQEKEQPRIPAKDGEKKQPARAAVDLPSTAHAVLLHPLITEKSTMQHSRGQYAFAVRTDANKQEVRDAVAEVYGVTAQSVNIQRYDGTWVTFGRHLGRTKHWKKAIVTLKEGETITMTEAV